MWHQLHASNHARTGSAVQNERNLKAHCDVVHRFYLSPQPSSTLLSCRSGVVVQTLQPTVSQARRSPQVGMSCLMPIFWRLQKSPAFGQVERALETGDHFFPHPIVIFHGPHPHRFPGTSFVGPLSSVLLFQDTMASSMKTSLKVSSLQRQALRLAPRGTAIPRVRNTAVIIACAGPQGLLRA